MQDLADEISLEVFDHLQGLSGFDHWWNSIDAEIQDEIEKDLITVINTALQSDVQVGVHKECGEINIGYRPFCTSCGEFL